ncbi:hypothetical protein NQ314_007606 [Rhamnusium bicolor]|uniref:G2/mitotic-specific cyclin-B3 n=1 Tax=Rhamnusium bicolor TaxID=1586634 RepID=A0AAV8YMG8_9CUCU|nr:hypothetical protein NQ314_007606 [Rhamnusium bicolor]
MQHEEKRKADCSPSKENKTTKRTAFGDRNVNVNDILKSKITDEKNKIVIKQNVVTKKIVVQTKMLPSVKTVLKPRQNENLAPPPAPGNKIVTRAAIKSVVPNQTALKPKEVLKENNNANKVNKRLSNEFEKTDESLYYTALEEAFKAISLTPITITLYLLVMILHTSVPKKHLDSKPSKSTESSPCKEEGKVIVTSPSLVAQEMEAKLNLGNHQVPEYIEDYDKENWNDIFQVSHYAMDIFNYLKDRESSFQVSDYMDRQICLTRWMRSLLVDWMVEIQESFELNHETLYLGVKLVDLYLSKMTVGKETLQLVGAAAMFIASKYDERVPPSIDDFLYICDGAYTRRELIRMEINVLKICDFDLGIPISYRFLRRYARCAKITMPVLTLARYILEYSLMDYATVTILDSKLASAALYLSLKMKKISNWTATLEVLYRCLENRKGSNILLHFSGYKLDELMPVVHLLNNGLYKPAKAQLMTVRNKYSHKIFFEVAKTPLIKNEDL